MVIIYEHRRKYIEIREFGDGDDEYQSTINICYVGYLTFEISKFCKNEVNHSYAKASQLTKKLNNSSKTTNP